MAARHAEKTFTANTEPPQCATPGDAGRRDAGRKDLFLWADGGSNLYLATIPPCPGSRFGPSHTAEALAESPEHPFKKVGNGPTVTGDLLCVPSLRL